MNKATINIDCIPIGKHRPRFARCGFGIRVHKAAADDQAENLIAYKFRTDCPNWQMPDNCSLYIVAKYPIPVSWTKRDKEAAKNGIIHPGKPDIDNVVKLVMDGLNGVAYSDDKSVVRLTAVKVYSDQPGISITIREV